jgi:hypothetical protein
VTLADRIEGVLREEGPLPGCVIATTVRKQKAEVLAALHGNPDRFVQSGKARASRWGLRREVVNGVDHFNEPAVTFPPDYDRAEEALVTLVRQGRECPYEALLRVVCAVNGAAA